MHDDNDISDHGKKMKNMWIKKKIVSNITNMIEAMMIVMLIICLQYLVTDENKDINVCISKILKEKDNVTTSDELNLMAKQFRSKQMIKFSTSKPLLLKSY